MVKRVGCALLLVGTALCSFVMIQVQAIVIVDARAYSGNKHFSKQNLIVVIQIVPMRPSATNVEATKRTLLQPVSSCLPMYSAPN